MLKQLTPLEMEYEELISRLDTPHSAILEGYWQGFTAHEIAEQVGETPRNVAVIMDTFRDLGY